MKTVADFTVDKELILTPEMHLKPIDPKLATAAGNVEPDVPPLVLVSIVASHYNRQWHVNAVVDQKIIGSIRCKPDTLPDEVLPIADVWIRTSAHVAEVPGKIQNLPPKTREEIPFYAHGIVLMRGDQV